jgi:DNA-binding GntR family transcriptional regulator
MRFAFHADLIAISGRPHTIDLLNRLHNQARLIIGQPLVLSLPTAYHDLLNALEMGDLAAAQTVLQAMLIPES